MKQFEVRAESADGLKFTAVFHETADRFVVDPEGRLRFLVDEGQDQRVVACYASWLSVREADAPQTLTLTAPMDVVVREVTSG